MTSGTYRSGESQPVAAQQAGVAASRCRSSSAASVVSISATISRGRILSALGWARSTSAASAAQQGDVAGDLLLDVGAQHLDHHLAAAVQRGRVHLGDAGRGQRRGVEGRRRPRHGAAERLLDQRARHVAVERRHAVLQQGQLLGDVGRHQVAAGRQDLPELDEDRAQFLQRQAQARAPRLCGDLAPMRAARTGRASFSQRSAGVSSSRSSSR
jgi:hypothetical protein